jgi:hypothetical protein
MENSLENRNEFLASIIEENIFFYSILYNVPYPILLVYLYYLEAA